PLNRAPIPPIRLEGISRLTVVDNALLMGPDLKIIGVGYQVPIPPGRVPDVYVAKGHQGQQGERYAIAQHGARHRAATWCAHENIGGLVFIVSQDGPLRCMIRPTPDDNVLLWNLKFSEI
ncbi:hypothetical protein, partial [Corallococcus exiguus]|uniref:hypothetical protein n=1 Tax=Corallococcus exiguus TaxID=83462 RepID=UPI001C60970F